MTGAVALALGYTPVDQRGFEAGISVLPVFSKAAILLRLMAFFQFFRPLSFPVM